MPKVLTCPYCYKRLLSSTYEMYNHIVKNHPEKYFEPKNCIEIQKETENEKNSKKQTNNVLLNNKISV